MATSNIRFEVIINFPDTQAKSDAISAFYTSLGALTTVYQYDAINVVDSSIREIVFGYILATQSASALVALATLNSSAAGPVIANQWLATSEP